MISCLFSVLEQSMRGSVSDSSGIVSVRQKWNENFGKWRYCLNAAGFVSAEIRVTYIFGNARHE